LFFLLFNKTLVNIFCLSAALILRFLALSGWVYWIHYFSISAIPLLINPAFLSETEDR
jgi:hypothetical protein